MLYNSIIPTNLLLPLVTKLIWCHIHYVKFIKLLQTFYTFSQWKKHCFFFWGVYGEYSTKTFNSLPTLAGTATQRGRSHRYEVYVQSHVLSSGKYRLYGSKKRRCGTMLYVDRLMRRDRGSEEGRMRECERRAYKDAPAFLKVLFYGRY